MHTSKDSSKAGEKWWPRSCPKCSHCPVNGIPSKQNKDYRNEENLYKAKGHHYAQNGQIIIYSEVERFIHTNMGQLILSQLLEKEMHDLWWLDQWLPTTALGDSCGEIELFCSLLSLLKTQRTRLNCLDKLVVLTKGNAKECLNYCTMPLITHE